MEAVSRFFVLSFSTYRISCSPFIRFLLQSIPKKTVPRSCFDHAKAMLKQCFCMAFAICLNRLGQSTPE